MNAFALPRSRWVRARDWLACGLVFLAIALPLTAFAQTVKLINGDVIQEIPLSDLRAISDTSFTLYDPYQGRDVEMKGVSFRRFLIDQFGAVPPALHFTAWDDYEVTLDGWDDPNWYLITFEDGDPLTIRTRGPARLVERAYSGRDIHNLRDFNDWIWMIRSIEAKW